MMDKKTLVYNPDNDSQSSTNDKKSDNDTQTQKKSHPKYGANKPQQRSLKLEGHKIVLASEMPLNAELVLKDPSSDSDVVYSSENEQQNEEEEK